MRCRGVTKTGKRCQKQVLIDSDYCAQHESQNPPSEPCARCGLASVHEAQVDSNPDSPTPLCENCALAFQRLGLEFLGVEEIDEKLLEFREKELG